MFRPTRIQPVISELAVAQRGLTVNLAKVLAIYKQYTAPLPAGLVSPLAHDAYLRGLYYLNYVTGENYERARTHLEQAIELDPQYAPAYGALAEYYWGTDKLPPQLAMPKAEEYTLRSLQLDESLPEAHSALAGVRFPGVVRNRTSKSATAPMDD